MQREVLGARFVASELPGEPTALLFTADWCGFCIRFLPHYRRFAGAWIVDISDEDDPLWDEYEIDVVPTVLLVERGKVVRRWAGILGARHADEIQAALSQDHSSSTPSA